MMPSAPKHPGFWWPSYVSPHPQIGYPSFVSQSGTLVLSTPPIAHFSEVYRNRKIPMLTGLIALAGSQIMFMEAPVYWLMILARLLQGISSTVTWTVGLALL